MDDSGFFREYLEEVLSFDIKLIIQHQSGKKTSMVPFFVCSLFLVVKRSLGFP